MRWTFVIVVGLVLLAPLSSHGNMMTTVASDDTFYVGGNGPGNYSSIQNAINDAGEGATIYVYPGVYNESVVIYKEVSLIGQGEQKPIVEGGTRSQKTVLADGVSCVVQHLVVANGTGMALVDCTDCMVADVVVRGSAGLGLVLRNSSGCRIEGCQLYDGNDNGIHVRGSCNNYIVDNRAVDNGWTGIVVFAQSEGNVVSSNTVTGNLHGIEMSECANNVISDNEVYQNDQYGLSIVSSANLSFTNNSVHSHPYAGLQLMDCHDCTVTGNEIHDNGAGVMISSGYVTSMEHSIEVARNSIRRNDFGVLLETSINNVFRENNFIDNDQQAWFMERMILGFPPTPPNPCENMWSHNYWSDWSSAEPKPIEGQVEIAIWLFILDFPWRMYDENPADEPYEW